MRRLVLIAALVAVASVARAQPAAPDSLARAFAAEHALPSLVVGITVGGERRVVGVGAVGDGRPDERTLYEIGSVSKVLTGLALADAVTRGEAALDTPVSALLPDSAVVRAHPGGPIRLVDLSTHRSGLPRLDLSMGFVPGFDMADPYALYRPDRLLAFLASLEPGRAPGEAYEYSNLAVGLLGFALATRAGAGYQALVRDRVLGPLGMDETFVVVPDSLAERLAPAHGLDGAPVPHWTWTEPTAGAGGWRSSAADLLALVEATLAPSASPLSDALALAQTGHSNGEPRVGLGWHFATMGGSDMLWHNGMVGGSAAFVGSIPDLGVGVVVLTNRQTSVDPLGVDVLRALTRTD